MTVPLTETPTVGLGKYIAEARFSVPSHQRDYSWKIEYVEQFVDDIIGAMKRDESIYFCGLMVFIQGETAVAQVLDGQQRLATTIMLFSAIRNWLGGYSDFHQFRDQMERYLGDTEIGETRIQPKLILNSANNDAFRQYVIQAVPLVDIQKRAKDCKKGDRNRSLLEAAAFLNQRIQRIASEAADVAEAKDYLIRLVRYVTDTVRVVRLIVRGEESAYTIFETLNDRGMELAPLDLVKNHIFSMAEKSHNYNLRDMEDRWTEMMALLSNKKADSFLRAFWASRHGVPEGARLFAPFKKTYDTPHKALQVSKDLRTVAEHYIALTDAADTMWAAHTSKAKESIRALTIVGSTQFHPVLLAALSKPEAFGHHEMERLLRLIEVLAVRYSLIGRGRPGRIESLGARVAKMILDGSVSTATRAKEELAELYVQDEQFKLAFQTRDETDSKKISYMLRALERQARQQQSNIHYRETTPDAVTIEHVLPKSPGQDWKPVIDAQEEDFHGEYLNRLGNLCLLSDANRSLGNKGFEEKKKVFCTSGLELTKSIGDYSEWTAKSIENRQTRLANLAVSEWRFH